MSEELEKEIDKLSFWDMLQLTRELARRMIAKSETESSEPNIRVMLWAIRDRVAQIEEKVMVSPWVR